ncbi:unnamed protein product [Ceutorhynchus assimilis]|uniref:3-hydroxyacyl-CoA dehydrogenase n=1 Tax=Ceutorhynchus assimilis TaxID=467358 RepID=A0A9N9QS74_9CUCU|nr:unnamed protein product [Ceutorhynchus assimilis]
MLVVRRYISTTSSRNIIKKVTVYGAGHTGSVIAQTAAQHGNQTTLVDPKKTALKKASRTITHNLRNVAEQLYREHEVAQKKFVDETMSKIQLNTKIDPIEDVNLIIDAITEDLNAKRKLFKYLDQISPEETLFASSTNIFSISQIASAVNRKDKFGGLHFLKPEYQVPLLEIITIPEQSQDTYKSFVAWGKSLGKTCVTCKDTHGFIVNRLLLPYVAEALRMVERGEASPNDIDSAMKLIAGTSMGPIELSDLIGQDTLTAILEEWHKKYPKDNLFIPVGSKPKSVEVDWGICVLCKLSTGEDLTFPGRSNRPDKNEGYSKLAQNLEEFEKLGQVPKGLNVSSLKEGAGLLDTLINKAAGWHRTCYLEFSPSRLERARKKPRPSEPALPLISPVKTRTKKESFSPDICLFCGSVGTRYHVLSTVSTQHCSQEIYDCAKKMKDTQLLAKLAGASDSMAHTLKANYHNKCRANYMKRVKRMSASSEISSELEDLVQQKLELMNELGKSKVVQQRLLDKTSFHKGFEAREELVVKMQ